MRCSSLVTPATMLLALAYPAGALGVSFAYESQTGTVEAHGGTASLGSDSDVQPIATLADVSTVRLVEDGDPEGASGNPPGYYSARAELVTSLGASLLSVTGDTQAMAIPDGLGGTFANAEASVQIEFALADPTEIVLRNSRAPDRFDRPEVVLEHLDLGLSFFLFNGGESISCGSLGASECDPLLDVLSGESAAIPAGEYRFSVDTFAYEPGSGVCGVGCLSMGGTASLEIVPEPSGLLPLGGAVLFLRHQRRRRTC